MTEALDYVGAEQAAASTSTTRAATLVRVYPYAELRADALAAAHRLIARGVEPGDRIALIAETAPEFVALFFGALYAGAWPVPLPLPTSFGGRDAYIDQLAVQLESADPALLFYPARAGGDGRRGGRGGRRRRRSTGQSFAGARRPSRAAAAGRSPTTSPICNIRAARPASRTASRSPTGRCSHNLAAHAHGMKIGDGDRGVSWLPFYHDMGLVGCMLVDGRQPDVGRLSQDRGFRPPPARLARPHHAATKADAMSYSPTFGYDICARRVSSQTNVAERFDLSRWRVAGNGADMIRPDVMQAFVDAFAPAGFDAKSFLPSYGLAEATLAVTVMPPGEGIVVELVEETLLAGGGQGERDRPQRYRAIVNCGKPVRDMEVAIRGDDGSTLGEREIGKVCCRGTSVMAGYFRDEEATARLPRRRRLARHRRHGLHVATAISTSSAAPRT